MGRGVGANGIRAAHLAPSHSCPPGSHSQMYVARPLPREHRRNAPESTHSAKSMEGFWKRHAVRHQRGALVTVHQTCLTDRPQRESYKSSLHCTDSAAHSPCARPHSPPDLSHSSTRPSRNAPKQRHTRIARWHGRRLCACEARGMHPLQLIFAVQRTSAPGELARELTGPMNQSEAHIPSPASLPPSAPPPP